MANLTHLNSKIVVAWKRIYGTNFVPRNDACIAFANGYIEATKDAAKEEPSPKVDQFGGRIRS